ncbi:hypothetical protein WJX74_006348 [Apatococcus lobatus]|uniref:Rhodanese domain-containing protein n=1 Tax=Apatococcus lobatus TaxID=904363 RepID=A0AAW1Q7B2_9CHLO
MPLNVKPIGGSDKLRKLPGSKKYSGVKPSIDSGFNEIKLRHQESERQQNARFHRGEHFRRLTVKQLVQLCEASDVELLILDLRDEEAYQKYHLSPAWSYPVRLLSRAFNPFTPEILAFRNQEPGRIIVLYDLCDEVAASAANLMFEKGIDNVFILNGGLQAVQKHRPDMSCRRRALFTAWPHTGQPSNSYASSADKVLLRQPGSTDALAAGLWNSRAGLAGGCQRQSSRGIIVPVNGLAVDRAVKQLQRKLQGEGVLKAVRDREVYVKPCHQRLLARKESAARHQKRMFKYKMNWAMWRRGQGA